MRFDHLPAVWSRCVAVATAGVVALAGGCGAPGRPELTDEQLHARALADAQETQLAFFHAVGKVLERIDRESESGGTLDVLALSGGGDFGAFGAGFLVGWGQVFEAEYRRPDFDVVTGVSTGALIAPFAFLGTDETCMQVETFYRNPRSDWVRDRGLLFFLPSNPSFMEIPGLARDVRGAVDQAFIEKMAAESRKGKVLAISATDLDLGRQKFWDLGEDAEAAVDAPGVEQVHRKLLSSAAIPAVFPPIEIGESVYADGGVTANVLLRLDPRNPHAILSRWRAAHPDKPFPKTRFWIIINNQLNQTPKSVQLKWPKIAGPSLATAIRSATVAEVRWLAAQADFTNAAYGTNIEVRVVAIPDDWRAPVPGEFQQKTMDSLAVLGRKLGSDPNSWKVWASPTEVPKGAHAMDNGSDLR